MINFALFGVGRIGLMHAKNLFENKDVNLKYIYDVNKKIGKKFAEKFHAQFARTPSEIFNDKNLSAVLIASPTNTHVDLIIQAAESGKHIFCEKPIDLSISKVNKCMERIKNSKILIQIGFNRRFDNSFQKIKKTLQNGKLGKIEKIIITSRDPGPPSIQYLKNSGGIFKDMTIHDFDLARFILGSDSINEIFATGSILFNKNCRKMKDFDTTMVVMKSKSGTLININNSRRATYGYDQRLEVFGSKGMIISDNQTPNSTMIFNKKNTYSKEPLLNFFTERYTQAFNDELYSFIYCIKNNKKPNVSFEDGRLALILAEAAKTSANTKKTIKVNYIKY